jgi:glycosyltransferase involved in cell wall biosynthesis
MRIAHIITRMMIGGAQENTLYNCQDLIRHFGDDVLLITGPETGPEGDLLSRNTGTPVPVQYLPELRRAIHPSQDLQAYRAIKRALREFQPDVVHTHSAKGGILGRLAASSLGVKAIVHTVHGAPFHPYQPYVARRFFQWCEWYAARHCHRLISVADAMTDLMVTANIAPRDKFVTINSGMEVEPFLAANQHRQTMRQRLGYTDHHIVIGKIARLFPLKGHDDLIGAAHDVVKYHPHVRFLLIGEGILRPQLERQIAAAGLTAHFHFAGLVDPGEIPKYLAAMDVLVHTSLREGLARALPQALIAGKPVVSYDIDGAREVCLDGETGFLVPPRDRERLADALSTLVKDATVRERLGQQGRQQFTDSFRHERMTRQIRQLYLELLGTKAAAADHSEDRYIVP